MIERILGVVCLIAAGAMNTAERLSAVNHQNDNEYVVILSILGLILLVAGYGRSIKIWIACTFFGYELKEVPEEKI